jgi:hypothetical protein
MDGTPHFVGLSSTLQVTTFEKEPTAGKCVQVNETQTGLPVAIGLFVSLHKSLL